MYLELLYKELKLNEFKLRNAASASETCELLIQRASLKDLIIEELTRQLENKKAA